MASTRCVFHGSGHVSAGLSQHPPKDTQWGPRIQVPRCRDLWQWSETLPGRCSFLLPLSWAEPQQPTQQVCGSAPQP